MTANDRRPARPSIYDVARSAGVSHMTVSRVVNGGSVSEATRRRVLEAIQTMGYRPSPAARALASRTAMRIGVIVHAATQYGPASTLVAIERAARAEGYGVVAYSTPSRSAADIECAIAYLAEQRVDATCVIGPGGSSISMLQDMAASIPVVVVGSEAVGPGMLEVSVDQAHGATRVMAHLIGLGHRSILHIAGPLDTADAQGRERAWRSAMRAAQAVDAELVLGDWTADFGFSVGARQATAERFTAVFAANDQMALGLIHGLWTRGIRVPADVSVVGFDDLPDAAHFLPPLTTVRQDFDALGRSVLGAVIAAIHGEAAPAVMRIRPELIVRRSTSAPRSSHPTSLPARVLTTG